ncbi:SLAIN motif-containing protein 2-like isoform X2 [Montipora capricornis]|uniref:SLAIN motif-containing protein 2-like isoform X2 n=1 Tax=Montipora foliosa TaxID=591990 RepID=UPI0035F1122F
MNAESRKSAGSDIKRLQEMVKRLEEQNAQLKNTEFTSSRKTSNNGRVVGEDSMVKVKLSLDDVPLLDLNAVAEEEEDTWLYVSPKHPPSAEQKSVSPYKYLKDSLDVPELNKVRGSLLAKLESIAAQEAVSRSPPHASVDGHHVNNNYYTAHNSEFSSQEDDLVKSSMQLRGNDCEDDSDGNEVIQVKPRRRVPFAAMTTQDDSDLVVKGPLRRRGAPPAPMTTSLTPVNNDVGDDSDNEDSIVGTPQRRVPPAATFNSPSHEDSSLVVRGPLRRRGPSPQPRLSLDAAADSNDNNNIVPQDRLQQRVPFCQDNEDLVAKGPLRRRGPGSQSPRQPVGTGSPIRRRGESPRARTSFDAASYLDDNVVDDIPQDILQRRVLLSQDNEDLVVRGPLKRRGGTPKPRQPVAVGYGMVDHEEEYKDVQPRRRVASPASTSYSEDLNSSLQRDEHIPIVTAVRRREPNQVRRREPAPSKTEDDIDVRRRSLPQAPTHNKGFSNSSLVGRQSPVPRKPTPRTGQLAAPRRVPTPRGVSPARFNEGDSWSEGFY